MDKLGKTDAKLPTGGSKRKPTKEELEEEKKAAELSAQRLLAQRQNMLLDAESIDLQRKSLGAITDREKAGLEIQRISLERQRLNIGVTNELTEAKHKLLDAEHRLIIAKLQEAEATKKQAEEQQKLNQAIAPLQDVAGQSAGAVSGLAGIIATSAQVSHDAAQPNAKLVDTIMDAGPAYQDSAQKFVESEQAKATVAAAMQTAFGLATLFTEPKRSVAHFLAAAAFGAIAMKKAGSSGGGESADQGSGALPGGGRLPTRSEERGGPKSIVINFHGLVVDPQATATQIGNVLASARGTGR